MPGGSAGPLGICQLYRGSADSGVIGLDAAERVPTGVSILGGGRFCRAPGPGAVDAAGLKHQVAAVKAALHGPKHRIFQRLIGRWGPSPLPGE